VAPVVARLPQNVGRIWDFATTEMINNAIDHSGSQNVQICVRQNALYTEAIVEDEGEGIFLKIQRALNLRDPRESILELAKGKLTTAPVGHSGEGIFFTSRAMDLFEIDSHHLRFTHSTSGEDSIADHTSDTPGTRVKMCLANGSTRLLKDVFDSFQDPEEYTFDKTIVPLRLAQYERENLVSRSQAKRVANRFERFKRVELDFSGVTEIGQAFADQLFRVFAAAHPEIRLVPVNTEPAVAQMIRRVVTDRDSAQN
jgi:anti-sigma regulatory factor (Ser/Thr protein kinase)